VLLHSRAYSNTEIPSTRNHTHYCLPFSASDALRFSELWPVSAIFFLWSVSCRRVEYTATSSVTCDTHSLETRRSIPVFLWSYTWSLKPIEHGEVTSQLSKVTDGPRPLLIREMDAIQTIPDKPQSISVRLYFSHIERRTLSVNSFTVAWVLLRTSQFSSAATPEVREQC